MTSQRRISIMALLVVAMSVIVVAAPARPAEAARTCTYFVFTKATTLDSTLTWKYYDDLGRCLRSVSWRAGSGVNTDTCAAGGWLPDGWYDQWGHRDQKDGQEIDGRSWYFQDKQCYNGTWRTELFIHTEETVTNGQSCTAAEDDKHCWETAALDYRSIGCIKVSYPRNGFPNDIASAHNTWHNLGGGNQHGELTFTSADRLFVD